MSFWGELKRRNVYKVGVAYVIVAWLIIQAVAIIFPAQHLPAWTVTFVIALLIIGFPLILLFAWAFEITPEGIKRTKEVPLAESITHLTGQKLNYIVTGLLVLAVGFLAFKVYFADKHALEQKVVSTGTNQTSVLSDVQTTKKTIAVLPFVNRSSEKDQEYFVDGLSDEIITMLSQISDLQVTSSTSSFAFKNTDKTLHEVASVLGVDHILEGSVRKAGNDLRITAQLIRVEDDSHLWSETFNRELKDIFAVQEDIATAVAGELKVTLGIDTLHRTSGGTENVEAYELFMVALGQFENWEVSRVLQLLDEAIALDSGFTNALAFKAVVHTMEAKYLPPDLVAPEYEVGLKAALKAIELEPNLATGYYALGFSKSARGEFIEAESAYHEAFQLQTETAWYIESGIVNHYLTVGNIERAYEIITTTLPNDPLNPTKRGFYYLCLYLLGHTQRAEAEYQRGMAMFGEQWLGNFWFEYFQNVTAEDGVAMFKQSDLIADELRENIGSPEDALTELRRVNFDDGILTAYDLTQISLLAFILGDPEFGLAAIEKAVRQSSEMTFLLWLPTAKEVRQLPRFKEFIREIGLVDYWNEFGWPDICHKLDNGDFECD